MRNRLASVLKNYSPRSWQRSSMTAEPARSRPGRSRSRLQIAIVLCIISVLISTGCVTTETITITEDPYWPSPPDRPRFQYDFTLRNDLSLNNTRLSALKTFFTGELDRPKIALIKPFDVAARGGNVIISDTAAGFVYLFIIPEREVIIFGRHGKGSLKKPAGVAIDDNSNYYVADVATKKILVYEPSGHFIKTIGEPGDFVRPTDVAVTKDGSRIYVIDAGGVRSIKHRVIAFNAEGKKLFTIGSRGASEGMFNLPTHGAVGPDGTLYVLDSGNFRVQAFDDKGKFLRTWGEVGKGLGQFARPRGIAVDKEGNVYVTDAKFGNFQIFNSKGQLLMAVGQVSMQDGKGKYSLIAGVAVDETGRVYVVDQRFKKVEVFKRLSEEEGNTILNNEGRQGNSQTESERSD